MAHWAEFRGRLINFDKVVKVIQVAGTYTVRLVMPNGVTDSDYEFTSEAERKLAFDEVEAILLKTKNKAGGHMFEGLGTDIREFLKSNRDMIWTVIFVLLVDQFAFEGAFRERVKSLLEGLLNKVEGKTAAPAVVK